MAETLCNTSVNSQHLFDDEMPFLQLKVTLTQVLKLEGPRPLLRVLPTPLVNLGPRNSFVLNASRCMRGATFGKKAPPTF